MLQGIDLKWYKKEKNINFAYLCPWLHKQKSVFFENHTNNWETSSMGNGLLANAGPLWLFRLQMHCELAADSWQRLAGVAPWNLGGLKKRTERNKQNISKSTPRFEKLSTALADQHKLRKIQNKSVGYEPAFGNDWAEYEPLCDPRP